MIEQPALATSYSVARQQAGCQRQQFVATLPHALRLTAHARSAVYKFIVDNDEKIGSAIVYDRDMNYDFFAFKTLERAYLLKLDNKIAERPQHMIMRGEWRPS